MESAPLPHNEPQRLAAVKSLRLLDTPIEERFERITRLAARLLAVPTTTFTLVDAGRQWFKSAHGASSYEGPRDISFCAHAILSDEVMLVPDTSKDRRFADNPLVIGAPYIGFYAGCPVKSPEGLMIGTICALDSRPRELSADEVEILRDMAALIETELQIVDLSSTQQTLLDELDSAQRLALTDPLTRVWNRRGIMELMVRDWSECARRKVPLGLCVCDIDRFKVINDKHGHSAGDEVIQAAAKILLTGLRTEDAVGRIGGEEFLIVLPGCESDQLSAAAERLRVAVGDAEIPVEQGSLNITMSFGVAIAKPHLTNIAPSDLIKQADDALYQAKRGGRNRVETARAA